MNGTSSVLFIIAATATLTALIAFGAIPRIVQERTLIGHTQARLTQAPPVSVVPVRSSPAIEEFVLPGTTQSIQDAPVYARVNGYLRTRYVDIGDIVHTGQVMAEIDTPELDKQVQAAASAVEQAEANLDNTREALNKAEADKRTAAANVSKATTDLQFYAVQVERYKELSGQGAVSLEQRDSKMQEKNAGIANLDAARSAEKSAQAAVQSARAAVHVAQAAMDSAQAQHDQYEATRSFKTVRALFNGVVTRRIVDAGALITAGSNTSNTILFQLGRTDIMRIFVYLPEQYVPAVHVGDTALLQLQSYPGKEFTGKVARIAGGLDPDSKTLQVEIQISNHDRKLLPGMYAQVYFQSPSGIRLPLVPAAAIQTRVDGCFIYTVDGSNRVHIHKVNLGRDLGGKVEISRGISLGTQVIVNPSDDIQDGLKVNPILAAHEEAASGTGRGH